jgi:hypothetical protein
MCTCCLTVQYVKAAMPGGGASPSSMPTEPWHCMVLCCCVFAEVQRRAAPVILSGADCVIASQTGSGETHMCWLVQLAQGHI